MTVKQVRELLGTDSCSKRGNVFTVRRAFFYTNGYTSAKFAELVCAKIPKAMIVDHGEIWKPFRGGATTAQGSHWFVKFIA